jgi:hypothetical protein
MSSKKCEGERNEKKMEVNDIWNKNINLNLVKRWKTINDTNDYDISFG